MTHLGVILFSVSCFFSSAAWNIHMMARARAVILDYKVTLRTENIVWVLEEKIERVQVPVNHGTTDCVWTTYLTFTLFKLSFFP